MRISHAALVATAAALLCSAACDASEASEVPEHSVEEIASALNAGLQGDRDLDDALYALGDLCMEDQGFKVHPDRSPLMYTPAQSDEIEVVLGVRYRFLSPQEVEENGYGDSIEPMNKLSETDEQFQQLTPSEQDRYYQAWNGSEESKTVTWPDGSTVASYPVSGCLGWAYKEVFGDEIESYLYDSYYSKDALTHEAARVVDADDAVVEANRAWVDCMASYGYEGYETPLDAAMGSLDLYTDDDGNEIVDPDLRADAKQQEIAMAESDFECNADAELDETRSKVFWDEMLSYFAEHEVDIFQYQEECGRFNERAQELLSDSDLDFD